MSHQNSSKKGLEILDAAIHRLMKTFWMKVEG